MSITDVSQVNETPREQATFQRMTRPYVLIFIGMVLAVIIGFLLTLVWGSVNIPLPEVIHILAGQETAKSTWEHIVHDLRLPRAITALLSGMALAVAGLQMQTLFRNALADPYILGVSSGASLGVGLIVLTTSGISGSSLVSANRVQSLGTIGAAAIGSFMVLALIMMIATKVRNAVVVLIFGVMVSAFVSAFVNVLIFFARPEAVKAFFDWHLGSFQGVHWGHIPLFTLAVLIGSGIAICITNQLNIFLLGENYAQSMGLSVQRLRWMVMIGGSLLAGAVTAYAGPIAFLGIAAPHLARGILGTSDHRLLVPGSLLLGALIALIAGLFAQMPGSNLILPLNSAMALIGAPIVVWVLLRLARNTSRGLNV